MIARFVASRNQDNPDFILGHPFCSPTNALRMLFKLRKPYYAPRCGEGAPAATRVQCHVMEAEGTQEYEKRYEEHIHMKNLRLRTVSERPGLLYMIRIISVVTVSTVKWGPHRIINSTTTGPLLSGETSAKGPHQTTTGPLLSGETSAKGGHQPQAVTLPPTPFPLVGFRE